MTTTQPPFSDQILHTTVRIECDLNDGYLGTGTGFFFNFETSVGAVPTIITNKHVIENSVAGRLKFSVCDKDWNLIPGKYHDVNLDNFESQWILHPDPNIDLAFMPTQPLHLQLDTAETKMYRRSLNKKIIPTIENIAQLTAIEDIIMVGYPNGLWDKTNNLPIIRRGITATPFYEDYEGNKEFMIDMACFPGSSGSPVFLFNRGTYHTRDGGTVLGNRIAFLGVLYKGPMYTAEGKLEVVDIPTSQMVRSVSPIPQNLGIVIKSERILDFEPLVEDLAKQGV